MTAVAAHSRVRSGSSRPYVLDTHKHWAIVLVHAGWLSVLAAGLLTLISVYCVDVALRDSTSRTPGMATDALKQLGFGAIGLFAAALIVLPHYRLIGRLSWALMAVSVALLIFLRLPGVPESIVKPINGQRCWINLKFFKLQPTELAKISYVLVTAHYLRF